MQIISLHITTYYQSFQNKNMTWYDMVISQEFEGYHRVMKVRSNITAPQYLRTFLDAIHKLSCSRFKPPGQDSLVISWCHVQTREYMPNGWQPTRNYNCDYNMSPEKRVIFIDILKVMSVSGVAKSMVICCWRCFILTKKTTIFHDFSARGGIFWCAERVGSIQAHRATSRALEGVPICQRFGHANCAIGYLDQFLFKAI